MERVIARPMADNPANGEAIGRIVAGTREAEIRARFDAALAAATAG